MPFYLLWISSVASGRRLLFNLAKELAVFTCVVSIGATFVYIFDDFLNRAVADISLSMRETFAELSARIVAVICGWSLGKFIRQEKSNNYAILQKRLPTSARQRLLFHSTRGCLAFGIAVAVLIICCRYLLQISDYWLVAVLFVVALSISVNVASRQPRSIGRQRLTLFSWRWRQMIHGQRLWLLIALLLMIGCYGLAYLGAPMLVFAALALLTGTIASFAIAEQAVIDMRFAWAERNFAISHDQFIRVYEKVGICLGGITALLFVSMFVSSQLLSTNQVWEINSILKIACLAALAPLIMPVLLLQIDVRRAAIQYMIVTICALFIGTAILANWFGVLLYPLLRYYSLQMIVDRFYRA